MTTGNSNLIPVTGSGWTRGLNNVLRGELKGRFSTRKSRVQLLLRAVGIGLFFLIVALNTPQNDRLDTVLILLNVLIGMVGAISGCIGIQSMLVGEKRYGTIAWILSKPVSRTAFIVAKLTGSVIGTTVSAILAPGLVAYLITGLILNSWLPIPGFLAALVVHLVNILFYMTLTLLMGVIFDRPAPAIGIPLATLLAQNIFISLYPPLARFVPWTLAIPISNDQFPSIAMQLMTGAHIPSLLPLYSTLLAIVIFTTIALWIFEKQDF